MNSRDYRKAIVTLVEDGHGYDALKDIVQMLHTQHLNYDIAWNEMKVERERIKKICEGNTSNNCKVATISSMLE